MTDLSETATAEPPGLIEEPAAGLRSQQQTAEPMP